MIKPVVLLIDNQSILKIIHQKHFSGKTRHLDIRYHMNRELVETGIIDASRYLCTTHMISNIGTKALAKGPSLFLRDFFLGYSTSIAR